MTTVAGDGALLLGYVEGFERPLLIADGGSIAALVARLGEIRVVPLERKIEQLRLSAARLEEAHAVSTAAIHSIRDDFQRSARERNLLARPLVERDELVGDARDDRIERCEGPQRDGERINTPTQVRDLVTDLARALSVHSVRDCEITIKINGDLVQIAHESSPLRSGPEVASSDVPATTVTETTDTAPFAGVGGSAGARADVSGTSTAPALADGPREQREYSHTAARTIYASGDRNPYRRVVAEPAEIEERAQEFARRRLFNAAVRQRADEIESELPLSDDLREVRDTQQSLAAQVRTLRRDVGRVAGILSDCPCLTGAGATDFTSNGHDERPSSRVGSEAATSVVPTTTVEGPSDIPPSSDVGASAGVNPPAPALTTRRERRPQDPS